MADDKKRPEPDLFDKNKGRLVEQPGEMTPTPAKEEVKDAERDLNKGEREQS